jgi:hypothetical protein
MGMAVSLDLTISKCPECRQAKRESGKRREMKKEKISV